MSLSGLPLMHGAGRECREAREVTSCSASAFGFGWTPFEVGRAALFGALPLRLLHHVRAPSEMAGVSRAVGVQLDTLRYGMRIYSGDSCRTARLVGTRKCTEVCTMMKNVSAAPDSAPSSPPLGPARRMGSKRKPVAPQRRKNASQVISAISWKFAMCYLINTHRWNVCLARMPTDKGRYTISCCRWSTSG